MWNQLTRLEQRKLLEYRDLTVNNQWELGKVNKTRLLTLWEWVTEKDLSVGDIPVDIKD